MIAWTAYQAILRDLNEFSDTSDGRRKSKT